MRVKQRNSLLAIGLLCSGSAALAMNPHQEPNQQSNIEGLGLGDQPRPNFWQDSSLTLKPRSYYLYRNRDVNPDSVGWALGGALEYQSGWWRDQVQLTATYYTSQELYGPEDKDGTQLFKPGSKPISVVGEANLTWRFGAHHGVRLGRQRFELPYLGSHDIRMVPNTFEGLAIGKTPKQGFAYMVGYVDKIKQKNNDEFVPMSEAAGALDSDEGVGFAGTRYASSSGGLYGGIYQHSVETFDTLFIKVEHPFVIAEQQTVKTYLQFTDQRSVGDEMIGEFSTQLIAAKLEWLKDDLTLRFGASTTDDDKGIQKPYGNPANYLSVIVEDFDRAGEKAWMVGASYDFHQVGVGDLSLFANVVVGNTPDIGDNGSPDQSEYDITFDYRIKYGWADRLWLRVRAAYIDQDEDTPGGNDFLDFRIIANYDYDFFQ